LIAGAAALTPLDLFADEAAPRVPGKEKLIVNSYRFIDLEMPRSELRTWITPNDLFFVRNHVAEPFAIDPDAYRLNVVGEVEHPLSLSLAELRRLEAAEVTNTLECAGNGRVNYIPHVPGVQWRGGAVGNARFRGPRMRDLLNRAGLKSTAKHVAFKGLEEPPGKVPQFIRSIPIEKATDPDTLVALQMNGTPLPKHNGFPARALVPGWIGAASCKWLTEIRVLATEFDGNYMKPGYRMPNHPGAPGADIDPNDTSPVTALPVKSMIASPADGAQLRAAATRITGAAWAGEADIARVEVSTDGGSSWAPADLGTEHARYAWRLWHFPWTPKPGSFVLMARATDSQGRTQPDAPPWNPGGYLWNGIDKVNVHVR
jgi:DMSO/TMAO reductase YedYZ molybdopterin-dependent catalytic subunit